MMKSNRNNRVKAGWTCPHCKAKIGANQFRLSAAHPGSVICSWEGCGKPIPLETTRQGKSCSRNWRRTRFSAEAESVAATLQCIESAWSDGASRDSKWRCKRLERNGHNLVEFDTKEKLKL